MLAARVGAADLRDTGWFGADLLSAGFAMVGGAGFAPAGCAGFAAGALHCLDLRIGRTLIVRRTPGVCSDVDLAASCRRPYAGAMGTARPPPGDPSIDDSTVVERPGHAAATASAVPEPLTVMDRSPVLETTGPSESARSSAPSASGATPSPGASTGTVSTPAEALRDEEIHRTRLFIRMGWLASVAGIGAIPFVDSTRPMIIAFVVALVVGMLVSFAYHQRFRDPLNYGPRAIAVLGTTSTINTHVAILFFGAFTLAPVLVVIGMHFIGRSELGARRAILATSCACHAVTATLLLGGAFPDPGVFATVAPIGTLAHVIGALFVQCAYGLAYFTGRNQRRIALRSLEQLHRTTRIASQRAALIEELRFDLARAQQIGAGRYTDQTLGTYRLGAVLGRGAHGEVYEASAPDGIGRVAMKVLHREHLIDPALVARFLREAVATAVVTSPHVVRVLGASLAEAPIPYLVMERLYGVTLADRLRRLGKLPAAEASALVTQIAAGLDAAATAGVVHRDLKPQNLLLEGTRWLILDFGVAALAARHTTLTAGAIVGTPQYMAPEQARGDQIDRRTDLHALGAIAYRVLTGRNPFTGPDTPAILYAVVHMMPVQPSTLAAVPADLDRWMALALAKATADRFPTGATLATAFQDSLRGELAAALRTRADKLLATTPWHVQEPASGGLAGEASPGTDGK